MAHPAHIDLTLWQTFVEKHMVGTHDQDEFLDYLTDYTTRPVATLTDLEQAYRLFLRRGSPPLDIH